MEISSFFLVVRIETHQDVDASYGWVLWFHFLGKFFFVLFFMEHFIVNNTNSPLRKLSNFTFRARFRRCDYYDDYIVISLRCLMLTTARLFDRFNRFQQTILWWWCEAFPIMKFVCLFNTWKTTDSFSGISVAWGIFCWGKLLIFAPIFGS